MRFTATMALALFFLASETAHAGLFRITNPSGTGLGGVFAEQIARDIETEVNKKLPSAGTQEEYFQGMSNATAIAAAGVSTSYATVFKHYLVGITASGGADLGSKSFTDISGLTKNPEQYRGFGLQAALVLGANVGNLFSFDPGWFDPKKLNVYLSGFALNHKFGSVNAKYFGAGVGLQYRIIDGYKVGRGTVRWTGIELGTNFLYSKLDIDADVSLNDNYKVTNSGINYNATVSGTHALITAHSKTMSVPIEASTGLRLLYFFKLVGGLGLDFNFGKTTGHGHLNSGGDITAQDDSGVNTWTGTPNFDLDGGKGPTLVNARAFFGPHFEFGVGTVFITVHKSLFEKTMAVNSGLNFFW